MVKMYCGKKVESLAARPEWSSSLRGAKKFNLRIASFLAMTAGTEGG